MALITLNVAFAPPFTDTLWGCERIAGRPSTVSTATELVTLPAMFVTITK